MNQLSVTVKYYLSFLVVVIGMPTALVILYEWLGGGVLNGFMGAWREPVVDPDILLLVVNPLLMLLGYALLIYYFRQYLLSRRSKVFKTIACISFLIASTVVFVGVFWKALST